MSEVSGTERGGAAFTSVTPRKRSAKKGRFPSSGFALGAHRAPTSSARTLGATGRLDRQPAAVWFVYARSRAAKTTGTRAIFSGDSTMASRSWVAPGRSPGAPV